MSRDFGWTEIKRLPRWAQRSLDHYLKKKGHPNGDLIFKGKHRVYRIVFNPIAQGHIEETYFYKNR